MQSLSFKRKCKLISINQNEILYAKSMRGYCQIYLKNGRTISIAKPLQWINGGSIIPLFLKVHRSLLVNSDMIEYFDYVEKTIRLTDGTILQVASRKLSQTRKLLGNKKSGNKKSTGT